MKPHFIIKLKRALQPRPFSWQQVLLNPGLSLSSSISKNVDEVLNKNDLQVIVTSEYELSSGNQWTRMELTNGLDRIYSIILKENTIYIY